MIFNAKVTCNFHEVKIINEQKRQTTAEYRAVSRKYRIGFK